MAAGLVSSAIFSTQRRRCLFSLKGTLTSRLDFNVAVDMMTIIAQQYELWKSTKVPFVTASGGPARCGSVRIASSRYARPVLGHALSPPDSGPNRLKAEARRPGSNDSPHFSGALSPLFRVRRSRQESSAF